MSDNVTCGIALPKECTIARTGEGDGLESTSTERSLYFKGDGITAFGQPESRIDLSGKYATEIATYMTDADGNKFGFESPNVRVNQFEIIAGRDGVDSRNPHLIQDFRDGSATVGCVLFAADHRDSELEGNDQAVKVGCIKEDLFTYDTAGNSNVTQGDIIIFDDVYSLSRFPCLSIAMNGTDLLYLFAIGVDLQGNQTLNGLIYRNGGWVKIYSLTLWTGTKTIRRVRVGNLGSGNANRWMALIHVEENDTERTYQYAGFTATSFKYIGYVEGMGFPEITWNQCEMLVFALRLSGSSTFHATVRRITDPFLSLNYTAEITIGILSLYWYSYTYPDETTGIAVARMHDNTLIVYGARECFRSVNGGLTWETLANWNKPQVFLNDSSHQIIPYNASAAELGTGQIILAGRWGTFQNNDMVTGFVMGGWSTRPVPDYQYAIEDAYSETWSGATCKPDDMKYRRIVSGGVTETLFDGKFFQIHQTDDDGVASYSRPGQHVYENPEGGPSSTYTETSFGTQAMLFHIVVHAVQSDTNGTYISIDIAGEGYANPNISIKLAKGFWTYKDDGAGIWGPDYNNTEQLPIEFMIFYGTGKIRIFWRQCEMTDTGRLKSSLRKFELVEFTPAQPVSPNDTIRFSFYQSIGNANAIGRYYFIDSAGFTELDNPYINDDVKPKRLGNYYMPSWLHNGALVAPSARAIPGDVWSISTEARFALEKALPVVEPRPSFAWQSAEDGVDAEIVFRMGDEAEPLGKIGAFIFKGINFKGAEIWRYVESAWGKVCDVDNALSISYSRAGKVITPGDDQSTQIDLKHHELTGYQLELSNGVRRLIIDNTTGPYLKGLSYPAAIRADMQPGDAASGTAEIIYPDAVVLFDGSVTAQYYKIVIPSQITLDGKYKGKISPAEIVPFVGPPDNGRIVQSDHNIEVKTFRAGGRVRTKRGERRHIAEFAWVQSGVDETWGKVKYWNGSAVGKGGSTPWTLYGLREAIQEQAAIYYIADYPEQAGVTIYGRDRILYGFMVGDTSRLEQVLGGYGRSVYRIPAVRIEEEL